MTVAMPPASAGLLKTPEILAPAGSFDALVSAIDYGADAVYCAHTSFGMRSGAKNFTYEELARAVSYAHERDVKLYVTCNITPSNEEIAAFNDHIARLAELKVDAVIVSDMGMLMQARKLAPEVEIHMSTQTGITNYQAANALYELGARRVVLARELDLNAIRTIRANTPDDLDIECFVHGSMCMAFSGRCMLSKYMTGRDANHGDCSQSCRWSYHLVEEKRPGEYFPIEQTDQGTYIFNSQDLNMLEHINEVIEAGVHSLKIEGRAKGAFYVATLTNAYKMALNCYLQDPQHFQLPEWVREEPYKVSHRAYSTGFFYSEHKVSQETLKSGYEQSWRYAGDVVSYNEADKRVRIFARNKIVPGDTVEFFAPLQTPVSVVIGEDSLYNDRGESIEGIIVPLHEYEIACSQEVTAPAYVRVSYEE